MNPFLILAALAVLVVLYFVFSSRKTQARLEAKLPADFRGAAGSVANATSGVRDTARSALGANNSAASTTAVANAAPGAQSTGNE